MLVMVISTVQTLHEILQLFYIINCIFIRPKKQIAAICKSSFFCVLKFALIFIWWSVETLPLCVDSITVFCYYMCFKKIKLQKNGFKLFDMRYSEREKNNMTPTHWHNFSVLSHFQGFLRAEMHILIFLAVVLFAPPCATQGKRRTSRKVMGGGQSTKKSKWKLSEKKFMHVE